MGKLESDLLFDKFMLPDSAGSSQFPPQVSVIIPIYNGEADLPALLNGLQQQNYPPDRVEFLLVDNNSTDQTAQILRSVELSSPANFRYLCEAEIQSAYAARNTGIRAAKGEILAFTDADCRPQVDWLLHLMQPFIDPKVGIVAGEVKALFGQTLLERHAERHATLSQLHTLSHPFLPYGQTANLAIRRSALEQTGLFRPYLTTGGDADLCWRILQQHWQIQLAEQAVVQHRHRATLAELQSQWRRYGRSNRYLHELHGIGLMQEPSWQNQMYRWSRWLLKELPIAFIKVNSAKTGTLQWIDAMVDTPLSLFCQHARAQGQRQSKLPDAAREIAAFPSPSSVSTSMPPLLRSSKLKDG